MREIKFRAWLSGTHDNIIFNNPTMDYDVVLSNKGAWCSVESGWDIQGEYPSITIMQYTGLKDKNGVDIYEGDLIELCISHNYYNKGEILEVFYCDLELCFHVRLLTHKKGTRTLRVTANKRFKVIGNIHENPELI